jgi:acetoin utilization deacetylase AcuC-like enzyme
MARVLHQVARELCGGRWVATGGGGYQAETVVPKVWTIHFAEMCGASGSIPDEWLHDHPDADVSRPYGDDVRRTVEGVLQDALPLLGEVASA